MAKALTTEEIFLFNKLQDKRQTQALNMKDHSMRALIRGSSDIYPDPAHFVYELLQNADDAIATEATFILNKNSLIFKHNGKRQFTITEDGELGEETKPTPYGDINSITSYSSTKENELNTIGKFGLGFKSVYSYTERPEIYDDKFRFAIEQRMVPKMLSHDHHLRKQKETLFYLPFIKPNAAYNEISKRLESLNAPTLFLHHLKDVKYINEHRQTEGHFSKTVIQSCPKKNLSYETIAINDMGVKEDVILFHRNVGLPNVENKEEITVGYYINDKGEINTDTKRRIHCFFPTKETFDLCFVSHAPFLLTNNRQNIVEFEPVNEYFISEICKLAADALVELRDYPVGNKTLLDENLYSILSYQYYVAKHKWYNWEDEKKKLTSKFKFLDAVKEIINKEPLLYTDSKKFVIAKNACVLSTSNLRPLLDSNLIKRLQGNENIELLKLKEESNLRVFLQNFFEILIYGARELSRNISSEFMQEQGIDWAFRLYKFLKEDARSQWDLFHKTPIFLSENDNWVEAYKWDGKEDLPNLFLPIKSSTIGDYVFINQSLIDNADEGLINFYKEFGINKPDIIDYIKKYIFPKYRDDNCDRSSLKKDFYSLLAILNDSDNIEHREQILNLIKENFLLLGTDNQLYPPKDLYIQSEPLRSFFKNNDNVVYFNAEYYLDDNYYITIDKITEFALSLGIKEEPSIISTKSSDKLAFNKERKRKVDFEYSTSIYNQIYDYDLEGLSIYLDGNVDFDSSKFLWNCLSKIGLKNYYGRYNYQYRTRKDQTFDSTIIDSLKHEKWIIDKNGKLYEINNVTQEDLQEFGYPVNEELYSIFKIKRRGKTIKELGGTEEQQRQQELGAYAEKMGITSKEKLEELIKKNEEKDAKTALSSNLSHSSSSGSYFSGSHNYNAYGDFPRHKETTDLEEQFNAAKKINIHASNSNQSKPRKLRKNIEVLKQKLEEDGQAKIDREILKQEADESIKYSTEWFEKRLELEYRDSVSDNKNKDIKRSVSISFSKIVLDEKNNRLYELRNPSRDVPLWVEEVENITINFLFNNREELTQTFEVANVREYTLRLKAKAIDAEDLASIDWSKFTKATLDINTPTNLVNNFRRAFKRLFLQPGFNLRDNLGNNLSFVFGPPGTGKTTHLADRIVEEMNNPRRSVYKVLVLAPTNKACDVLVRKIMEKDENCSWLGRFVTTGDTEIENMGVVCDRDSHIYAENKCCIVTTMARLPYDGFKDDMGEHPFRELNWNLVICDEASMIPIAQIIYAIYKFKNTRFLIAGDPMQISPIDVTNNWDGENIYDMINLKSFDTPKTKPIQFEIKNLETQYRSIPAIGGLFSDYSYNGQLNHHWNQSDQLSLNIPELPLKSINFIPFTVERFDSMFGARKLADSPIHIYSALLCSHLGKYLAKKYVENNPDEEELSIGIICPYASQAQLIQKIIEQVTDIPDGAKINVGTVHSFQGDQCNIIISMMNPPVGLYTGKRVQDMHINNKNIINVAISRAKDYLCLLIPDQECDGYENLIEINKLGLLSKEKYREETALFPASKIEQIIFGQKHFLEHNTFVTSHQLANVYTTATQLYEIHVDENSIDIQINSNCN